MPYFSQDMKKEVSPVIRAVLKKFKAKGSISVKNYSKLVVTVSTAPFAKESEEAQQLENEILHAMNINNGVEVEDGDYGTVPDYYTDFRFGTYDKPFVTI